MDQKEADQFYDTVDKAMNEKNVSDLLGVIAIGIVRIAAAQEDMLKLAVDDMNAHIEEVIQSRAEERAQEMDEEKAKRSYIGSR